jgi:hypothetical protein
MFKKVIALLVVMLFAVGMFSATLVSATIVDAPDVTLTQIPGFTLNTASHTVIVQGNARFSTALKSLVLSVSTDGTTYTEIARATNTPIPPNPNNTLYPFSFPWTVKAEDIVTVANNTRYQTFFLKVTATAADVNSHNGASGFDMISVTVTLAANNTTPPSTPPSVTKDEYPAAPAIAVKWLNENNYTQNYKGVNLISLVAHTMQKGAKFPEYNSSLIATKQILEKTHANYKSSVGYFLQKTIASITSTDKKVKPAVKPADPGKSGESKGKKK